MNMGTIRCDNCKHNNVCKYKDYKDQMLSELRYAADNIKDDLPFSITINCKYFSQEKTT